MLTAAPVDVFHLFMTTFSRYPRSRSNWGISFSPSPAQMTVIYSIEKGLTIWYYIPNTYAMSLATYHKTHAICLLKHATFNLSLISNNLISAM